MFTDTLDRVLIWSKSSCALNTRVKSGSFGHTFANSGNPDETAPYEPSHQDFHCLLGYLILVPITRI